MALLRVDNHATQWRFSYTVPFLHMSSQISFIRRLGPPHACAKTEGCPDIFELADGDFAVIGADITADASNKLPPLSGCAAHERIIRIPRKLLLQARADIPAAE